MTAPSTKIFVMALQGVAGRSSRAVARLKGLRWKGNSAPYLLAQGRDTWPWHGSSGRKWAVCKVATKGNSRAQRGNEATEGRKK